jgi:hypothetical protein
MYNNKLSRLVCVSADERLGMIVVVGIKVHQRFMKILRTRFETQRHDDAILAQSITNQTHRHLAEPFLSVNANDDKRGMRTFTIRRTPSTVSWDH